MPTSRRGQLITFAIEIDQNEKRKWMTVAIKRRQTIAQIAGVRGHPEDARLIADHNNIRSVYSHLGRKTLKVPIDLATEYSFSVLAGDGAPTIVEGYSKIAVVDRPQRTGLTVFTGYDPIQMDVPIWFEAPQGTRDGEDVERDIAKLELMAGRGIGSVSGTGVPPIVRVSVRRGSYLVPLIPRNYQWDLHNKHAPVWRIMDIDWDTHPVRNKGGNRIRQQATVRLRAHTRLSLFSRGASARSQGGRR